MPPLPDAAEKRQSSYFGEDVYLQNIVLRRELIFYTQDLAYPKATGKLLRLGRLVTREAPQDPEAWNGWALETITPSPLTSQG